MTVLLTPISNGFSYLPVTEFLNRVDERTIAQLASDNDIDIPIVNLPTEPKVLAACSSASGMLEAALLRGKRYLPNDLLLLCGVPRPPSAVGSTSGGTLATGTYSYRISAITSSGETFASNPTQAIVASGSTGSVSISWTAVPSVRITSYKVYGRTVGNERSIQSTAALSYTDTGAVTPGALPLTNPTAGIVFNGQSLLYQVVSDLAFWYLAQRRPERRVRLPETLEDSQKVLQMLADGEMIFGFNETAQAGLLNYDEMMASDFNGKGWILNQSRRFFGRRTRDTWGSGM